MKARIALTDPNEVEVTVTLTMKLKDWKRLRDQVADQYPGWELRSVISDLVAKAGSHFEEQDERA